MNQYNDTLGKAALPQVKIFIQNFASSQVSSPIATVAATVATGSKATITEKIISRIEIKNIDDYNKNQEAQNELISEAQTEYDNAQKTGNEADKQIAHKQAEQARLNGGTITNGKDCSSVVQGQKNILNDLEPVFYDAKVNNDNDSLNSIFSVAQKIKSFIHDIDGESIDIDYLDPSYVSQADLDSISSSVISSMSDDIDDIGKFAASVFDDTNDDTYKEVVEDLCSSISDSVSQVCSSLGKNFTKGQLDKIIGSCNEKVKLSVDSEYKFYDTDSYLSGLLSYIDDGDENDTDENTIVTTASVVTSSGTSETYAASNDSVSGNSETYAVSNVSVSGTSGTYDVGNTSFSTRDLGVVNKSISKNDYNSIENDPLHKGEKGKKRCALVKHYEGILADLGYLSQNKVDTKYDKDTIKAVRQFQIDVGIYRDRIHSTYEDLRTNEQKLKDTKTYSGAIGINTAEQLDVLHNCHFTNKGRQLLKEIELPTNAVVDDKDSKNYRKSYFVYKNGDISKIRCQNAHDDGITIGWGYYVAWNDTDGLKKLETKYGIKGIHPNMTTDELYNIEVPIETCTKMFEDQIAEKSKQLRCFLGPELVKLSSHQFDALLIHKYLSGSLGISTQRYLKDNIGKFDRVGLMNNLLIDLKNNSNNYESNKEGWTNRINDEMNVFFNGIYKKTY